MGSPKPSGIIKPSVPSPLAKNVDEKWLPANGKNMRGNPLIVRLCEKCIKSQRCVLHQTNVHHALWSTTPKATRGYSPAPHSRGCGCSCPHEEEEEKKSGQDQCSQSTTGPTTGPADVDSNTGLGWIQNAKKTIKETPVGYKTLIEDGPWT